jgi:hypothetical protein
MKLYYCYYYLTAIGLTPGGSSTLYIHTQTVHTTQRHRTEDLSKIAKIQFSLKCEMNSGYFARRPVYIAPPEEHSHN